MFDQLLLQSNNGQSSSLLVLLTVLIAFVLSSLLVITYDYTTKGVNKSAHFLQSLALMSVVSATVIQAIGDSVGLGLGMIGVFSIIRFRTPLDNPRNMAFMFASLGVGIGCGVYGYRIAIIGTLGFCFIAILISFTSLGQTNELIGALRLLIPKDAESKKLMNKILNKYCNGYDLDQYRFLPPRKNTEVDDAGVTHFTFENRDHLQEVSYLIKLRSKYEAQDLSEALEALEGFSNVRIKFTKENTRM